MKRIFSLIALLAVFSTAALADVRVPDTPKPTPPKKAIDSQFYISIRRDVQEARLLIPKSQLKQLRAELEQLDDDSGNTAAFNFSRTQTVLGGLFLSLAFVFGGVWFTRSRKTESRPGKALAAGSILFLSGALATIAFANVGPPPEARSITGKIFSDYVHQYKQAAGKVKVEITEERDGITLIVPDAPRETKTGEE